MLFRSYRLLNFDTRSGAIWGELTANATGPLPVRDSCIAAIVRSRGYRIVTRDAMTFERMGCRVVDPWKYMLSKVTGNESSWNHF